MSQRRRARRTPHLPPASPHRRRRPPAANPVSEPSAGRRLAVGLADAAGPALLAAVVWWTRTH